MRFLVKIAATQYLGDAAVYSLVTYCFKSSDIGYWGKSCMSSSIYLNHFFIHLHMSCSTSITPCRRGHPVQTVIWTFQFWLPTRPASDRHPLFLCFILKGAGETVCIWDLPILYHNVTQICRHPYWPRSAKNTGVLKVYQTRSQCLTPCMVTVLRF